LSLIRNGVRVVAIIFLLSLVMAIGIETGWFTPFIFQKQIVTFCEKLEASRCKRLLIKNVKGGIVWGLSVARIDFTWKSDKGDFSFYAPFCKTNLYWKDIAKNYGKKETSPYTLTIFHPQLKLKTSKKDLDDSLLKSLLIPFNQDTQVPFQHILQKWPFDMFQLNILKASFQIAHKGKNEINMENINCFYSKKGEDGSKLWNETFNMRGDFQGKDIFFLMRKGLEKKEIFSVVRKAFFDKDLIVRINHEKDKEGSDIVLYLEDLFKIKGLLEYMNKGSFSSRGTILPENIFWKKAKENRFIWRLLKDIDPYDYDSFFIISGSEEGIRIKLTLHERNQEEYCFVNLFLDNTNIVKVDMDLSGLLTLKGDYDFLKGEVKAKLDFKGLELAKVIDLSGYERDKQIRGYGEGEVELSGLLNNLTVKGELNVSEGKIDVLDFQKAVFRFSGTGRFIFLENSKFIREEGEIPVVGYLDTDISNPLRNVKVKPKNALVWSGIDIIKDEENKTLTLKSDLSDRLNLKLLKKSLQESGSLDEDEIGYKIELDLDESNKFMYKKDEDESFFGIERTIKF